MNYYSYYNLKNDIIQSQTRDLMKKINKVNIIYAKNIQK